ncbi:MAG: amino acid adenylation domain-containing protein [Lachnospiraceae bacterium]|nr:amino acid adenylation domain-containing protein [Lachnospiraceae bacterium]
MIMDAIYTLFQSVVDSYPDDPAIIEDDRVLTFQEFSHMVDRIASGFPDDIHSVGIVMRHRAEMIASIFAVLKCGARYIPAEPDFPTGRIRDMMTEAEVDFVLTEPSFLYKLQGFSTRMAEAGSGGGEMAETDCAEAIDPESPAYVLFTSGTTGRPKGVCVRNRNVCHYVRAFENEFHPGPGDVMLQYSVCSFDIFVEEVFASLLNGAALAIPSDADKENVLALMSFVARHQVTIISGFPYLLAELNHLPAIPASLRLLISGGDVLRGIYVDNLLCQAQVYNTYGPSETTVCASYYCCNQGGVLEDGTYPIGRPVKGVDIRLLDQSGNDVPAGETGEICIYGDGVSMGYIGDHEEENRAFVTLPDGSVMYRSGDLGYFLPDGNLAFLHRMDDQIMIYGKRVETAEVESRLYQCKNVHQAVVRAMVDDEGLSYMVAYIVPAGPSLNISGIKEELAENLPSFMIPEFFVEISSVPVNPNGKTDVKKLPIVRKGGSHHGNSDTES